MDPLLAHHRVVGAGSHGTLKIWLTNRLTQPGDGLRDEPKIVVQAEDVPERVLLDTRICKEDGFAKQQGISGRTRVTTNMLTTSRRDSHRVDRTDRWRRYGAQLSRSRRMCRNMVWQPESMLCNISLQIYWVNADITGLCRKFVNTVQQHLAANGAPGK